MVMRTVSPTGTCSATCQCEAPVCGNGLVEGGEQCDPQGVNSPDCVNTGDTCSAVCQCEAPVCGNSLIESTEECDPPGGSSCPFSVDTCNTTCGCDPSPDVREFLAREAATLQLARLTLAGDTLYQATVPAVRFGTANVVLPARSFLQAAPVAEATMVRIVTQAVEGAKRVVDGMGIQRTGDIVKY